MFQRSMRRRYQRGFWPILARLFYINPQKQYMIIVVSAIAMATLVFSGLLLFRQSDQGDLMTRGRWLAKQGKMALAVAEYEQLVRTHRGSYEGHLELGKAYLEVDEPEKAAEEFRMASRLKSQNLKASGAHVAISRMLIAQGQYKDAEKQLIQAYNANKANRKDSELLSTFVDLYDDWGDYYVELENPDYERAFLKYSAAMRFVKSVREQKAVEDKLVTTATRLSDIYDNNKEYDKAIAVMKRAIQYQPTADSIVALAALYEEKEDLDNALEWYRKAYALDPKIISLKLSSILLKKGKELTLAHRTKEAETYFNEAKKINETVRLPMDMLYPVEANQVNLTYHVETTQVNFTPAVKLILSNKGSYPIQFLAIKAFFMSGTDKLAETQQLVASANDPLAGNGEPRGERVLTLSALSSIPLEDLNQAKLQAKIMIAYTNESNTKWYDLKTVEVTVPEAKSIAGL